MNDKDRLSRLEHLARLAGSPQGSAPPVAVELKLAARERRVLEDRALQAKKVLALFERTAEHVGAAKVRQSVRRLELEVLNARARSAGLPVPSRAEHQPRGRRERAAF